MNFSYSRRWLVYLTYYSPRFLYKRWFNLYILNHISNKAQFRNINKFFVERFKVERRVTNNDIGYWIEGYRYGNF
ncbi:putative D ORF I [Vaccinia virus Copenhagen]|uniref:Uncharacterized 9.5 kDa protein n=3 Tax=Vaccinia virus TaxID=10245 RepID=YVDI_VACCC|nr:RecName: Full=Uncharacterized 9.5 kDa protein [Vaccinia virus Copenhagen]AAF33988.1 unknown [Vaccinia virus Tian Tan]ABZ80061.1 unknown [synthetic Vaccinia virus]AGJ91570.1 hypothetical protein VACV_TT9_149 [Vaccinia virus]AAA48115.1 putative D ORF I [Vaccinia virus Copenhagen]AGJ92112.1 hypothetical protein VACV_TT11_149 [Vaccinia virus]